MRRILLFLLLLFTFTVSFGECYVFVVSPKTKNWQFTNSAVSLISIVQALNVRIAKTVDENKCIYIFLEWKVWVSFFSIFIFFKKFEYVEIWSFLGKNLEPRNMIARVHEPSTRFTCFLRVYCTKQKTEKKECP